jgi:hypothetical protein
MLNYYTDISNFCEKNEVSKKIEEISLIFFHRCFKQYVNNLEMLIFLEHLN